MLVDTTLADRARPGETYRRVFVTLADRTRYSCLGCILDDGVVCYVIRMRNSEDVFDYDIVCVQPQKTWTPCVEDKPYKGHFFLHLKMRLGNTKNMRRKVVLRSGKQLQRYLEMDPINMGPTRDFKLMKQTQGGYENVGASEVECKNFERDLISIIGEGDVDLVIEKLSRKRKYLNDCTFEFCEDADGVISGLFWADEESKRNYVPFGDVVGFDATYRTNKCMMVFLPFTDNHKKYVTFAAGLLCSETKESYKCLLTCFRNTFGTDSTILVTDQDPSVKGVIPELGTQLAKTGVSNKLHDLIWDKRLTPEIFENEWQSIMDAYALHTNSWFTVMFDAGASCIPAHCFYILRMSGIERFPAKYVANRWRKDVVPRTAYVSKEFGGQKGEEDIETIVGELHSAVDHCVDRLSFNLEKLCLYRDMQRDLKKNVDQDTVGEEPMTNKDFIETVISVGKRTDIQVRVPNGVWNKGSMKRLISEKEKAIISAKKGSRKYGGCGKYVDHNARTCPNRAV
ncbi:hypothetical protein LXL04_020208 [Taraxacum kok-saghyz]